MSNIDFLDLGTNYPCSNLGRSIGKPHSDHSSHKNPFHSNTPLPVMEFIQIVHNIYHLSTLGHMLQCKP